MEKIEELMTTGGVAEAKQVSKEAVRQAVKSGALIPARRKRPLLFDPVEVEKWTPYGAIMRRAAKARKEKPDE